jgi:hypothetical protein
MQVCININALGISVRSGISVDYKHYPATREEPEETELTDYKLDCICVESEEELQKVLDEDGDLENATIEDLEKTIYLNLCDGVYDEEILNAIEQKTE